jgi:metal-responsive CopG/Arc/MetJ family transcriptional regulator
MTQISIRLPDVLLEKIDEHAEERDVNRSELIRRTLESRFGRQPGDSASRREAGMGDGVSRRDAADTADTVERETYEQVRSERDRLEGRLEIKDDLLEAKDDELDRLERQYEALDARLSESQRTLSHVNQQRSQEVERYEEQRGIIARLLGR